MIKTTEEIKQIADANDATPVDLLSHREERQERKGSRRGISRRNRSSRLPNWWSTPWIMEAFTVDASRLVILVILLSSL